MEKIRNPQTVPIRYHYMDNLRALAMMLGVFFHASLCYCPIIKEVWITYSSEDSFVLSYIAWFSHLFRMPLFFLIAGFFAYYLVNKRGIKGFIRNRSTRILLPFVIFLPIIMGALVAVVIYILSHVEYKNVLMQILERAIGGSVIKSDALPQNGSSTAHLWFLYNLILFYIMIIILFRLKLPDFKKVFTGISPKVFLLFFPLLLVPALYTQSTPYAAPEKLIPALWSFGFYGIFFLLGWFLYNNIDFIDALQPFYKPMLAFCIAGYALFYYLLPEPITSIDAALEFLAGAWSFNLKHMTAVLLEAYISIYMTFLCLIGGKKLLDRKNGFLRLIADSSYWVYLIHLPIILFFDAHFLNRDINPWITFSISSFGTILIGLITYVMFVRWTPLGWMLNGRRPSVLTLFRQDNIEAGRSLVI